MLRIAGQLVSRLVSIQHGAVSSFCSRYYFGKLAWGYAISAAAALIRLADCTEARHEHMILFESDATVIRSKSPQ